MKSKDEEMLLELNKVISYAHVMLLNSKTSEDVSTGKDMMTLSTNYSIL